MFRKLITMPIRSNMYNRRVFSSSCNNQCNNQCNNKCNNKCKVNEITNNLIKQERLLKTIDDKIGMLSIMLFTNVVLSIFC